MPAAAPPRDGPSPPYSAVAPHDLGFPPCGNPPPAGTLSSSSSGKPRHGFEAVPDTEDARTPGSSEFFSPTGSSEFFLREPPGSSEFFLKGPRGSPDDYNTPLAHTSFTHEQQVQLNAQVYVYGDLRHRKPPAERPMILAFGEPLEGHKHAWEEVWRAAVDRWESQKSLLSGFDTPPSISLVGSCTGEEGSTDSTVGKSTISGQDGSSEKETQGLNVGSASIHPPKNTTEHAEMLEQKNGDEDHLAVSCTEQVDQVLSDDGSNLKKNAICGGQTFLQSHRSLPKNNPWNNMTHIQECYNSQNKSGTNSPRDIQESNSSRIASCIGEEGNNATSVGKTFISEQHSSKTHDSGEEVSQGPDFRSDRNHPAESSIDKVDQVLSDDANNLEKNTVCGGQTLLSCFKCGKNEQLLKCHSCPIAVHGSCFSSSVRSDDGQFYCPVCFCYKATEAYKKAEKTLFEASKDLSAFLTCSRFAKQDYKHSTGNQQSAANSEDKLNKCCTTHLSRKDENSGHEKRNAASDACPEVVVTEKISTFGQNSGRANNDSSHEVLHSSQNRFNCTADRKLFRGNGLNMSRRRVRFQPKRTVVSHSYGEALKKQAQLMHSPARKRCYPNPPECQSSRATPARNPHASTTTHGTSTERRKATKWTRAEVAVLKEGVAKFTAKYGEQRNISWVWVREYGKGSFNPMRVPTDLKDKWRNMKEKGSG